MVRVPVSLVAMGACLSMAGCDSGPPDWLVSTSGTTSAGETTAVDADTEAEVCAPKDPSVCAGGCSWSLGAGSAADEWNILLGVDCGENVVVAGDFNVSLDFGGDVLEDASSYGGETDLYVAKLGPGGKHLWSKAFGDKRGQRLGGMAVDSRGAVALAGFYEGSLDFGAGPVKTALTAAFVAKLDAAGNPRWTRSYETQEDSDAWRMPLAIDANDNLWITGSISAVTDFGGGPMNPAAGVAHKLFVAKIGPDGEHLWSRSFDPGEAMGTQIAFDHAGNAILVARSHGAVDLDGAAPAEAELGGGMFLAKIDPDGKVLLHRYFPDHEIPGWVESVGFRLAVDSKDEIVIAGGMSGVRDLGGGPLGDPYIDTYRTRGFVAKYDAAGELLWNVTIDGDEDHDSSIADVVITADDHIHVAGYTTGGLDVGGVEAFGMLGVFSPFVAELGPDGAGVSARAFVGDAFPSSLRVTPSGTALLAGSYSAGASFGQGPMSAHGTDDDDLFVVSYSP